MKYVRSPKLVFGLPPLALHPHVRFWATSYPHVGRGMHTLVLTCRPTPPAPPNLCFKYLSKVIKH